MMIRDVGDDEAKRIVVWYAQGIVMSELHCTSDEARSLMITLSRQQHRSLESIACDVIQRSLIRPLDEEFGTRVAPEER
jgi:AmiR/NasT family two-component response regulator